MDDFFPFIHQKKEKESPKYLYLELDNNPYYKKEEQKEESENNLIIIEIL